MRRSLAALVVSCLASSPAGAAETVVENGVTYQITRRMEKTPVTRVHMEERTETVYRTETITQFREESRAVWVPVTDFVYEPRWHNWWNPLAQPIATYELKPRVRWELRWEKVSVPVTTQRVVPEQRIAQVPVRTLGFAEREVVERVAVKTLPPASGTTAAANIASRAVRPPASSLDGSRSVPAISANGIRR